jgi:hypothetical protein
MSEGELVMLFSAGCQGNARIQADPHENTARNMVNEFFQIT